MFTSRYQTEESVVIDFHGILKIVTDKEGKILFSLGCHKVTRQS